jgi:LTXXQ motif family protein
MRSLIPVVLFLAAIVVVDDASAQQRRHRSDTPHDESRPAAPAPAFEPYAALERELPSLKVDLKLTGAQAEAWMLMERDVRHAAELDRSRLRRQMALRDAAKEPPAALTLVTQWAVFDRRKAEHTAELVRHLADLQALLDDEQRRMLDRRLTLSQAEPLGR